LLIALEAAWDKPRQRIAQRNGVGLTPQRVAVSMMRRRLSGGSEPLRISISMLRTSRSVNASVPALIATLIVSQG
jgi:hypothetical protein